MEEPKITKWENCPIDMFYDIYDIIMDEDTNAMQKNIKLISLIYAKSEDDVYSLDILDYNKYILGIQWINNMPSFNKNYSVKSITIDGKCYDVTPINKLSIGQYIDFQTFWQKHDEQKYIGNILASFIVPKGKKYGEEYDILELATTLRNSLDIVTARNLMFFFLKRFLELMVNSFICLKKEMKKKQMKKEIDQLTTTLNIILDGLV